MDNDTFDLLKSNIAKHKFWNNKHQNLTLVSRDSMHLDESEKPLTSSDNDLIEATWGLGGVLTFLTKNRTGIQGSLRSGLLPIYLGALSVWLISFVNSRNTIAVMGIEIPNMKISRLKSARTGN